MKAFVNCIFLFALCIGCFSCSVDVYLRVGDEEGKEELVFTNSKGSRPLTINSNRDWTISSSAPWCAYSLGSGTKTETITISVEENTAGSERECTLTVKADGETKTIRVVQHAIIDYN
jgi:uncharacterized membrane protein